MNQKIQQTKNIKIIRTPEEISQTFDILFELRPHLENKESFVSQIIHQQRQGYKMATIWEQHDLAACIGFRTMTTLAWGKIIYVDDLITGKRFRKKEYGESLLDYVIEVAKDSSCHQVHLDTAYTRHVAHRLYLRKGFELRSHHLVFELE